MRATTCCHGFHIFRRFHCALVKFEICLVKKSANAETRGGARVFAGGGGGGQNGKYLSEHRASLRYIFSDLNFFKAKLS